MRSARNDDGFVLIAAIILLTVMMGLGLGLLLLTDSQQKASASEQASEAAFNVAEAALNAQIGQLSRAWPGEAGQALPERCTETTSTETNGCPTAASLKVGYSSATSSTTCPAGTPKDAWGSPLTNEWTTYVRDDVGGSSLFNSATEEATAIRWAEHSKVWVRSVGVVQCRMVALVALISPQIVSVPFPQTAIAGNWFETSNKGNKVIINTQGKASQSGGVGMRCNGHTAENCEKFREGQVKPDTKVSAPPEHTLSASQLETLKNEAKANNTYFPSGKCPGSLAEASGTPAYVEGPCELSYTGNGTGNSEEQPGFLVLINGTFQLNGTTTFFGTVYAANAQNSSGIVVELHGHSHLKGSIVVDGNGGLGFGSSGGGGKKEEEEENENFVYNNTAALGLKGFAGASATRNSFRVLPVNQ